MDAQKRKRRKETKRNAKKLRLEDGNCETGEKTLTTEQQKPIDMALQGEDKTEQQKSKDMALQGENKTEQQKPIDMALQVEDKTEQQKPIDMALQGEDKTEQQKSKDMALQGKDKTEQQKPIDMVLQGEDKTEQQKPIDMVLQGEDKTEQQKPIDMVLQGEDKTEQQKPIDMVLRGEDKTEQQKPIDMALQVEDKTEQQKSKDMALQGEDKTEQQKPIDMVLQVEDKTKQQKPIDMVLQVEDKTEQQKPIDMVLQVEDKTKQQKPIDMVLQVEDKTEQQKSKDMALQGEDKTEQQKPIDMVLQVEDKTKQQKPIDMVLQVEDKTEQQKPIDMALQGEDKTEQQKPIDMVLQGEDKTEQQKPIDMVLQGEDKTEQQKPIDMVLQGGDKTEQQALQEEDSNFEGSPVCHINKEQEDSDEERSVGMITPTLLEQIKTILSEYPDDAQIIREMVQNAEDAGATCMKIMCDYRTSVPEGTSDIKQYFQTPGICVYNDAMFSEKDWTGIITIYGSVKKEEPLKVGRFGLGFKSVFHMTDSPVIISGNKLLIIDPLKSENKEQECRVIPLKALKKNHCPELTLACIMNRFGFDSSIFNTETPGQYMGTLFWLPLRQKQSTLSSTVYSEEKARRLLTSFEKEASYNVLFLKSLEKIELYNTEEDESSYSVEMYGVNQNKFRQDRADFCNSLNKLNKELPLESITSKFEAVIKTPTTEDHYTVVSCLTGTNLLSDGMKTLMADKDIHNSPYTGVAYCTQTNRKKRSMGHIFCFLPLPITENSMTGLPVHVNGFLDLEQNRRHVKEGSSANEAEQDDKSVSSTNEIEQTDKSVLWNGGMIKELIPASYYVLIENLKAKCIEGGNLSNLVSDFYDSIPNPDNVQSSWQPLITSLNKKIIEEANFYTKQGDGMWIKRTEALFTVFDEDEFVSHESCREVQQTVRQLLLDCEETLVELPSHMIRVLEETGHSPQTISSKLIRDKIRNFEGWHSYSNDKKLDLLAFILKDGDYDDLKDIELLPLNSETFLTYSSSKTNKVYVVRDKIAELFPGLEERFISRGSVMDVIWNHLNKMAKEEKFQLSFLTDTSLPEVLQQTFDVNCTRKDGHFVSKEHTTLGLDWIEAIWKEIASRQYENLDLFESIPVIPLRCDINSHHEKHVKYLTLKGNYMLAKFDDNEPLPEALEKVLELMGIHILTPEQTLKFPHAEVIGKYIKLPIYDNILKCFKQMMSLGKPDEIAKNINEKCSNEERTELSNYLVDHCSDIHKESQSFLRMLKIFKQHDNVTTPEMVSLTENETVITKFTYPKGLLYPRKLLLKESAQLVKYLGGDEIEVKDCIDETLDLMLNNSPKYSPDDKVKLIVYLTHQSDDVLDYVQQRAEELVFMPSSDGKTYRVKDLFEATLVLQDLFLGEKGVFPDETFLQEKGFKSSFLSQLKIKTEENVSQEDLVRVARSIDNSLVNIKQDQLLLKAESLCKFFKRKPLISQDILDEMEDLNWIPVNTVKPEGCPDGLSWYGDMDIVSPSKVKSSEFQNLVGSVIPLVSEDKVNKQVASHYRWNHPPDQNLVLDQLKNIIEYYQPKQNSEYMHLTKAVFKYLNDLLLENNLTSQSIEDLCSCTSVPTKNGFRSPDMVVIAINNSHIAFNLEPYIYELPGDMLDYSQTFMKLGVRNCVDFEVLKSLLSRLSQKYSTPNETAVSHEEVRKDRTLVVNILKAIINMGIDKTMLTDLLVPITSPDDCLRFEIVENCTYTSGRSQLSANLCGSYDDDDDDDNDGSGEEKVIYVHADISSLAPSLGVASVTKRFIFNQKTEVLAWGQEEKLTTRISNLLDSYTDGFAVPKELVQNADDAGATKVCFLFDERENMDCRDGLFDPGLAECQGQALWVYNDATFEEKDFENIIKLGGKTKIMETDKIGKFGLGFCSIYNLTDVPSFVSKKTFVLLDPHLHHLGDAAIGTNPGLRVPLNKSYRKNFPNQFLPFNGIFGCDLTSTNKEDYKGTLFRLPLRTQKQAIDNDIKKFQYTKREVIELLLKFVDAAANLLLFTQNVTEIFVYHLNSKSISPNEDKQLLFRTWKSNVHDVNPKFCGFNVLKEVTHAMKEGIKNPIQFVDIGIEVCKAAEVLSPEFRQTEEVCSWVISWGTGKYSFDIASQLKDEGAIPVGSVAVPVKRNDCELASLMKMDELPNGFYTHSRIFCFMPLPVETSLPLHINGCFMVENSRKGLVQYNTDDKTNDSCKWNESMLGDVILSAYIQLLCSLAGKSFDRILESDYWTLWPKMSDSSQQDLSILIQSFYKYIIDEDVSVFYRRDARPPAITSSLSNSVFLHPKFRATKNIGDVAFECILQFHQEKTAVMNLPLEIYRMFELSNQCNLSKLEERMMTKYNFFCNYFFPNVKDEFWDKDGMSLKRDMLLIDALEDESLLNVLKSTECIPVKCIGKSVLRKPSDLVLQSAAISDMFDESDLRFPTLPFDKYKKKLVDMGMMLSSITSEILIERAASIKNLTKRDGEVRIRAIIKYLNSEYCNHLDAKLTLQTIQFLPVMRKPNNWPLPWKGDEIKMNPDFLAPVELFSPWDRNIVGSVGFIMDDMQGLLEKDVLQLISVNEVLVEHALTQLEILGKENLKYKKDVEVICDSLYPKLNDDLASNGIEDYVLKRLKDIRFQKVICLQQNLVEPDSVALDLKGDCSPYLYKMTKTLQSYGCLWKYMGIPEFFDSEKFIQVLMQRKNEIGKNSLSAKGVWPIADILDNLCKALTCEERKLSSIEKESVFVPDNKCCLQPLSNVYFDDHYREIMLGSKDVHQIHKHVRQDALETLGVMSKRRFHLSRFSTGIPFGQKEKLVVRLKKLISASPRDHSVLNELLQNADDAGGTEIHFVLDLREHNTKRIFDKKWAPLQGPALCVFNNTCFSDDDLLGIQNLGEGSKSDDPTKTGQFGVGFNAVYHLTDVPSFLTRGSKTPNGGTFCVFDPHCSYAPTPEPDMPGMQIPDLEMLENSYSDIFNTYLQRELPAKTGTWFRFPLRTKEMAKESDISKDPVDMVTLNSMLLKMTDCMKNSLLFLANVKKISVSYINQNSSSLSGTSTVELNISDRNEQQRQQFMSYIKADATLLRKRQKQLKDVEYKEVRYDVNIKKDQEIGESWLVVQGFGFPNPSQIPEGLNTQFNDDRIGLLPRAGTSICMSGFQESGKAFCFLPLPIETGLPVHVNGHFALDENRSHIFGGTYKDDIRYIWNKCLVEQAIAHSYASCIEHCREKLTYLLKELNSFFQTFPIFEQAKDDWWKMLTLATYQSIYRRELALFPIYPSFMTHECTEHLPQQQNRHTVLTKKPEKIWVATKTSGELFTAFFDDLHEFYEVKRDNNIFLKPNILPARSQINHKSCTFDREHELRLILIDLGMKIVCTPKYIYESINKSCQVLTSHPEDNIFTDKSGCICTKMVNPENIIDFLKSWNTQAKDKCLINMLDTDLSRTKFQNMRKLLSVLLFCLEHADLKMEDLENVPLLVNNNNILTTFRKFNDLIFSQYCNIFLRSGENFVHQAEVSVLSRYQESFGSLKFDVFMDLLPKSVDPSRFKGTKQMDWNDEKVFPNKGWMKMFWRCLDTFDRIESLGEWCLFPCIWEGIKWKLVRLDLAYTVLDLQSFKANVSPSMLYTRDVSLLDIFTKMSLPSPLDITFMGKHQRNLVAMKQNPSVIISCLYFHRDRIAWSGLKLDECDKLLAFFNDSTSQLTPSEQDKLNIKSLCLFTTVTRSLVSLEGTMKVLVVKCENLTVNDGLDDLSTKLKTVLLKHNVYHENLYKFLGCTVCYPTADDVFKNPLLTLYTSFILPNFPSLKTKHHLKHLEFVRDKLMMYEELKPVMENVHFIPSKEHDVLKRAGSFFSPHNSVCAKLCDPTDLPPLPFSGIEWKDLMELSGMRSVVTKELFSTFAKQIQQNGKCSNSEEQSKELISHLFSQTSFFEDTAFLNEVSQITFISPYVVPSKYISICQQNSLDRLISFQQGVKRKHFQLVWTMECILPEYAVPRNNDMCDKLYIKQRPSIDSIVSHIHKVCYSLMKHKQKDEDVQDLMTWFYEYLSKDLSESEQKQLKLRFGSTPIIHITEDNVFVQADQVAMEISKSLQIVPYLMKASVHYGKFFPLFKTMGTTDEVSFLQYCKVLEMIKNKAKEKVVIPEELEKTKKAVKGILGCLYKKQNLGDVEEKGTVLYLLNGGKKLKPSNELVSNDDFGIRRRLNQQTVIHFLYDLTIMKKAIHDMDPEALLNTLPPKMRPLLLSSLVKEELFNAGLPIPSEMADKLESFISGGEFQYIVTRLAKTFQKETGKNLKDNLLDQMLLKLKAFRVVALPKVETVLIYNIKQIDGSKMTKTMHFVEDANIMYIQGDVEEMTWWISKGAFYIARIITSICQGKVNRTDIQAIVPYLSSSLPEIKQFLDVRGAVDIDFDIESISWYPKLGSAVEQEFIDYLIADFSTFQPGDIAVYERFDNAGDSSGQDISVYIYVKIIRKISDIPQRFPLYLVNMGDGQETEVRSYRLYKIVRPSDPTSDELEVYTDGHREYKDAKLTEILQMIEETLVDAWNLGEIEFKRILRRLIRRWHPDKNQNSNICGDVFKQLMEFVKQLQSGVIDAAKIDRYREHGRNAWKKYKKQATSNTNFNARYTFDVDGFAEDIIGGYRRRYRRRQQWVTHQYFPDPQPHMGRIWIQQAKYDIAAAMSALENVEEKSCNWVCVQSQQAAEKALKAVQVVKDAKRVGNDHSLLSSVAITGNADLQKLAHDLETKIVQYSRLRYPRLSEYPDTPSDLYTKADAEETVKLAVEIVNIVDNCYFQ